MVLDFHLVEDGGAVVGDDDFAVRTNGINNGVFYLTSILSIPFGPREVLSRDATVRAARMFAYMTQIRPKTNNHLPYGPQCP